MRESHSDEPDLRYLRGHPFMLYEGLSQAFRTDAFSLPETESEREQMEKSHLGALVMSVGQFMALCGVPEKDIYDAPRDGADLDTLQEQDEDRTRSTTLTITPGGRVVSYSGLEVARAVLWGRNAWEPLKVYVKLSSPVLSSLQDTINPLNVFIGDKPLTHIVSSHFDAPIDSAMFYPSPYAETGQPLTKAAHIPLGFRLSPLGGFISADGRIYRGNLSHGSFSTTARRLIHSNPVPQSAWGNDVQMCAIDNGCVKIDYSQTRDTHSKVFNTTPNIMRELVVTGTSASLERFAGKNGRFAALAIVKAYCDKINSPRFILTWNVLAFDWSEDRTSRVVSDSIAVSTLRQPFARMALDTALRSVLDTSPVSPVPKIDNQEDEEDEDDFAPGIDTKFNLAYKTEDITDPDPEPNPFSAAPLLNPLQLESGWMLPFDPVSQRFLIPQRLDSTTQGIAWGLFGGAIGELSTPEETAIRSFAALADVPADTQLALLWEDTYEYLDERINVEATRNLYVYQIEAPLKDCPIKSTNNMRNGLWLTPDQVLLLDTRGMSEEVHNDLVSMVEGVKATIGKDLSPVESLPSGITFDATTTHSRISTTISLFESEGPAIGTVVVSHMTGELHSLYVETSYRGKGYGAALMTLAMSLLQPPNNLKVKSEGKMTDAQLVEFYSKFGFYLDPKHTSGLRLTTVS